MVALDQAVSERLIDLGSVKTRILEVGSGYPTFCLHGVGFTNGANTWLSCFHAGLGDKLHAIAIDQIGWGTGDRPTWEYQFSYFVDHIRRVQDALGYEKINLVGHSLGGWVSAVFAYESPERLNKLVLVANAGLNPQPPASVANFQPPTRESVAASFKEVANAELRDRLIAEAWRNVEAPHSVESYSKIMEALHDMDMRRHYFLRPRLKHIKVPTLIVYGSRDRGYPVDTFGKEMHDGIAESRFEVVDSGHPVPTERPQELTALIQEFLSEAPPSPILP